MLKIAVGPGGDGPRWTEWTDTIMKAWQSHTWSWDFDGLSMHSYTVPKWPPSFRSVGFGETEYVQILKTTLEMEKLVTQHSAIMDKYDPEKKVALVVDEWGARYAPLPRSHPGFLVQQNSMRDAVLAALNLNVFARHADRVRMANIAQMVNVLQAMILTDKEKMVLTSRFAAVVRVLHAAEHVRPAPAFPDRRQPGRHRGHHRAAGAEHDRRDPPVAGTPETVEDGTPGRRAGPWRRDGGRVVERR
jgi:alpha-L-arabinofuranosidase